MKHRITRFFAFFSVFAFVVALSGKAGAQTITCGTGTSSSYTSPFNLLYNNSWHEMIFQPSEVSASVGCSITKIAFQSAASATTTHTASTLKIYMGTRSSASHSSATDWTPAGSLQLVYSGTNVVLGNVASGEWQTFTLNTPYEYDGSGNLVVVVSRTASSYNSSVTWYYSSVDGSANPGLYRQSDGDASYGSTHPGTNSGTTYGYRANTRFTYGNCCSVQRTGTFEFRNGSTVVTSVNHVIGTPFTAPTLVNNLTPAGTPTYSSSNTDVATVNSLGEVSFTGQEGTTVITAFVPVSGNTCSKMTSYTINVNDGCLNLGMGTSTIGSGPIYGLYKNSYNQMIYSAAEVGNPGLISQIAFNASAANSQSRTIDVYVCESSQASFNAATPPNWIPISEFQHVYRNTNWHVEAGWNYFPFDEPFLYTGTGNLVVAIDCGASDYSSTSFYYTTTTGNTMAYAYSDTYDAVPASITGYSGSTSYTTSRPNMKLCIEQCSIIPENFGFSNSLAMCYLGGQPSITLNRGGNNAQAQFSSSDPSVATVDENGVITTHSLGTTTISVMVPIDGDICSARDSYELQVICPAAIPSAQSAWVCNGQQVDLTASVRDDNGELEIQWFDGVTATTPVGTGETFSPTVSATTTYYVAAYNTVQNCYSSRVPSVAHVFEVTYDAATTNVSGYVNVPMYGYAPGGSHENATFSASGMPAWLTLNSDGSFSGTPTAAGSGSFTITATNANGCSRTVTINWTVANNNLSCCDPEGFYIYQDAKPMPIQLADDGYYYADVCLNTAMTLRVVPRTTCTNYSYSWRLASSTGGLITENTGTSFTYTYDRTAGYNLTLNIRKTGSGSCSLSIPIRIRVAGVFEVATRPSFNLCHGEPFNIYVSTDGVGAIDVVRPSGISASTLGVTDTVLLPDGEPCNGRCFYKSSVTFADFSQGATVRNANDILYVAASLEHTFIGDIYIAITCPNGSRAVILPQSGNGSATCHDSIPSGFSTWEGTGTTSTDFGEPNSGNSSDCDPSASGNEPGTGWTYIWSSNTSRGYTYAGGAYGYVYESENVGNDRSSTVDSSHFSDMSQIYHPYQSFDNLIGCPLNGTWSIEVVDGWGGDNGHIFHWELGLNEELLPDSWSYEVDLDSSWVTCGWNSSKSGVYMEIVPPDDFNGTESCDLFLRDEYGCTSTYENIVTVTMNPTVHSTEVVDGGQCEPYTWARNNQTYTASGAYVDAGLTPQGCPDTATLVLTVSGSVYDTVEIQSCDSYTWPVNGQTYSQSGTYTANLTTVMGCDSIITLNLEISNEITVSHDTIICPDNFPLNNWYGDWGDFAAAGTLQQHFTTANGCDSLVVLTVQAYPKPDVTLPAPAGAGGCPLMAGNYVITPTISNAQTPYIYSWTGDYIGATPTASISATGTCGTFNETLYLTDANGCMDTATVTFSAVDNENPYFVNDMADYTEVPAEVMGQDCRFRIPDIVAILQPVDNCGIAEMIQQPLPLNDITVTTTVEVTVTDHCGNQVKRYINVVVPSALTANELAHTNESCEGSHDGTVTLSGVAGGSPQYTYSWSSTGTGATDVSSQTGTTLVNLAPGTYTVTITDAAECSIEKSVTVGTDGHHTTGIETFDVCDEFTWHGTTYTQSNNTATYQTTNAAGCDSTVTLNLTVRHSNSAIFEDVACETYEWHSNTYTESTETPTFTCPNVAGCDSVTTLHLTVYHSEYTPHYMTACDTYTWTIRGHSYTRTSSDVIVDTYTMGTCNGADTMYLTINHSTTGCDDKEACDQYIWSHNGQAYTQSVACTSPSAPRITMQNANSVGCDSTVVLNLTIKNSTHGYDVHNECDSYLWPMDSRTYYTSTTQPSVDASPNAAGCDSTVHLNLTIRNSSSSVVSVTACDSYVWNINGQTYTASTNEPSHTITNRVGCDSVIHLHLTVNNTRYGAETDTVCFGDRFSYHGQSYPAGQHTVTLTASNNCDSIVALQVVARPQLTVSVSEFHSCELAHYEVTGTVNAEANIRWSASPADPDLDYQRNRSEISVNPSRPTDYTLTAGYGANLICPATASIHLTPLLLPISDLVFNPPFLTCDNLDWTATSASSNAQQLTWYVDDVEVSTETAISGRASCHDDSVRVSLVSVNGICTNVLDTVLYVRKSNLWFPNVFTPNLNINKTFAPIGHGIVEYELYIYTREGLLVFHTNTLEEGWRGDHHGVECPRAAYTYIARYRNEVEPNVWNKVIGTVMLLR